VSHFFSAYNRRADRLWRCVLIDFRLHLLCQTQIKSWAITQPFYARGYGQAILFFTQVWNYSNRSSNGLLFVDRRFFTEISPGVGTTI
jgi:hypothetical protein